MKAYYTSRILISIAFGLFQFATGALWWEACLVAAVLVAFFIWAPRSGRYVVYPEFGVTALRRDEQTRAINDKAARNAFVVMALAIVVGLGFAGGATAVSTQLIRWLLLSGISVYFLSDLYLRQQSKKLRIDN